MHTTVALVPAAGRGVRLGTSVPKAFVTLGQDSLLALAVDGLLASEVLDQVVVMVPPEWVDRAEALLPADVTVIAGGVERGDSVRAGLEMVAGADTVLVHDAARALTPPALISRVVAEVRAGHPAVVPAIPVTDTIKLVDESGIVTRTPERAALRAIQTPQGFAAAVLRRAYAQSSSATDDAGLVEALGVPVRTVPGDSLAFKITNPVDLRLAEMLRATRETLVV